MSHRSVGSAHAPDGKVALLHARDTYTRRMEGVSIYRQLGEQAAGRRVKRKLDGRARQVEFRSNLGNILDSVSAAGSPAPYVCKAGGCATCRAKVVAGKADMLARHGLTDAEVEAGYVPTCQAVPAGDGLELDYDE